MTASSPTGRHAIPFRTAPALVGDRLSLWLTPNMRDFEYESHLATCEECQEFNLTPVRVEHFLPECLYWSGQNGEWRVEDVRVAGASLMMEGPLQGDRQMMLRLRREVIDGDAQIELLL